MMKRASRHQGIEASRHRSEPARPRAGRRGFTLTELMIAVAILIVVIVATAKLFGTVSKVTGLGQASSDILQEAAAIERQIRNDFARLAPEGFFVIRSVAVRNDINGVVLLNPSLSDTAMIRADQLVFFANGVQSIQTFRQGAGSNRKGQGTAARIYYGHAFQLPQGEAVTAASVGPSGGSSDYVRAHDPGLPATDPVLVPWYLGPHDMVRTVFRRNVSGPPLDYSTTADGSIDATQPPARQWLLARQAVVLADDGGEEVVFLGNNRSAFTVWDDVVRNGRVDAAAEQLNDIRSLVTIALVANMPQPRPWWDSMFADDNGIGDQRSVIASAVFYPRAERVAPGMHRVDQALTNNALAGACSSFIIDWTYADGVGNVDLDDDGIPEFAGALVDPAGEQPWFGLRDPQRGVDTFRSWQGPPSNSTIFADNIEPPSFSTSGIDVYEAIFGYNQDSPLDPNTALPWDTAATGVAYTPWPSAIRITMTLHDTATRLEAGREIQFVINLPRRIE